MPDAEGSPGKVSAWERGAVSQHLRGVSSLILQAWDADDMWIMTLVSAFTD